MIEIKASPHNEQVFLDIRNGNKLTRNALRHAFFDYARDLQGAANKEILRKPKGGKTYIIRTAGGRRRRHVASKPGETHANLSGKLRRSLGWRVRGSRQLEFGYGAAGDPVPDYAEFVERGTARMFARPSVRNAINATIRDAQVHFRRRITGEFNK